MKTSLLFAATWLIASRALAQSPETGGPIIPFQALVTDQSTNIVKSGKYTVTFQIYDQAVGGTLLWSERHEDLSIQQGMVNVFLGSGAPLTRLTFSQPRFLGITLDLDSNPDTADPEMVPRQRILPAFWAKNSDKLAGFDWSALFPSNSPSGTLLPAKIGAGSIATHQLAANAVTAEKLAPGAVGPGSLQPGSVASSQLQDGAITDADIGVLALTQAKREAAPMAISPTSTGGFAVRSLPDENGGKQIVSLNPVALLTTGRRPVWLGLTSGTDTRNSMIGASGGSSGTAALFTFTFLSDGVAQSVAVASVPLGTNGKIIPSSVSTILPPLPAGAAHVLSIEIRCDAPGVSVTCNNLRLFAFEL